MDTNQGLRSASSRQAGGGLVVIQEVFGVNSHIRSVADGYAKMVSRCGAGLFDRIQPGIELGYEGADCKPP